MTTDLITLTDRQEKRIEEFLDDLREHGAESPSRWGLIIEPKPEVRPGRGHDVTVAYVDPDIVAVAYIDVYGNGSQEFGAVEWTCVPEMWCPKCEADDDGDD